MSCKKRKLRRLVALINSCFSIPLRSTKPLLRWALLWLSWTAAIRKYFRVLSHYIRWTGDAISGSFASETVSSPLVPVSIARVCGTLESAKCDSRMKASLQVWKKLHLCWPAAVTVASSVSKLINASLGIRWVSIHTNLSREIRQKE